MDLSTIFFYMTIGYSLVVAVVMFIQALSRGQWLNSRLKEFLHTSIIFLCGLLFYYWQTLVFNATWSTAIVLPLVLGFAISHGLPGKVLTALSRSKLGEAGTSHLCLIVALLECTSLMQLAARHLEVQVPYADAVCTEPPGKLCLVEELYATTDLGNKIRLYRREVSDEDFANYARLAAITMKSATEKAIRRADPSRSSNCHGWVFTQGEYILSGADVPKVLEENGYRQVDKPAINDVVTYQDRDGGVIHTGVVRALYDGSIPMVESKWGMTAVYVHLVGEQPYSGNFSYWRSSRTTHQLNTSRDAKFNLDMARLSTQGDLKL